MIYRCGIPVVIMGETGCGKTRLIRYMCALQAGSTGQRNMLLMKVNMTNVIVVSLTEMSLVMLVV